MGKLNIAHHKSYHPYRRDNIEKVRRDEEQARIEEDQRDGRMMLADSEARIDLLRERAGSGKSKKPKQRDEDHITPPSGPSTQSHINFFEDLEKAIPTVIKGLKKNDPAEQDKGVPLAPSAKDLKPWYSERSSEREADIEEDRRKRDLARKTMNDPLTFITKQLSSGSALHSAPLRDHSRTARSAGAVSSVGARLSRESSERQRALALIRGKQREAAGSGTPSTVHGGLEDDNLFNRKEVEEAKRERARYRGHRRGGNESRWERG